MSGKNPKKALRAQDPHGVVHLISANPNVSLTMCGLKVDHTFDLDWEMVDDSPPDCPTCLAYLPATPATNSPEAPYVLFGRIHEQLDEAEAKAIDSLSRYKFTMAGYWMGVWVHLNRLLGPGHGRPSPFKPFVKLAKELQEAKAGKVTQ